MHGLVGLMDTGNVQIWLVGADPDEALDAEIFPTIDAAMEFQQAENKRNLVGDLPMRVYSATVHLSAKDLAVRA